MDTLTEFREAILILLDDANQLRYADVLIDSALRWAIIEFRGAKPSEGYDIQGLDGAVSTTLDEEYQTFVCLGAAGYCALQRSISRTEIPNINSSVVANLRELSDMYLTQFRVGLGINSQAFIDALELQGVKFAYNLELQDAKFVDNLALQDAKSTDNLALQDAKSTDNLLLRSADATYKFELENFRVRNKDVFKNYQSIAAHYKMAFDLGLADAARQRGPAAKPSTAAWNDPWHGW
jgi:hypothetical protein